MKNTPRSLKKYKIALVENDDAVEYRSETNDTNVICVCKTYKNVPVKTPF